MFLEEQVPLYGCDRFAGFILHHETSGERRSRFFFITLTDDALFTMLQFLDQDSLFYVQMLG